MRTTVVLLLLGLLLAACGDPSTPTANALPVPAWAKVAPEQIAEAKKYGVPVAFENDRGMRFVLVPAGTFTMGLAKRPREGLRLRAEGFGEIRGDASENPQREVTVHTPFYMQITEVTNAQYRALEPSHRGAEDPEYDVNGDNQPVVMVTWSEARAFAREIGCRLPTDVEWERAARGGLNGNAYPWGDVDLVDRRNGPGAEDGYIQSAPVASYAPNRYGLYDVVGNVWEYCVDEVPMEVIGDDDDIVGFRFGGGDVTVEEWREELGTQRVIRGDSWMWPGQGLHVAGRSSCRQDAKNVAGGVRLVSPLAASGK